MPVTGSDERGDQIGLEAFFNDTLGKHALTGVLVYGLASSRFSYALGYSNFMFDPTFAAQIYDFPGIAVSSVDWFIPHQANLRILEGVARRCGIDEAKVVTTVGEHANTSAASIPLALYVAVQDGRIKPGQLLLLEAMGGGLTWGACVLRL